MQDKFSIRFFNDQEIRAVWDAPEGRWRFAAADITAAVTGSTNPRKYSSVLKSRLKKERPELTTDCSQLRLTAADGKRYLTDTFLQNDYA